MSAEAVEEIAEQARWMETTSGLFMEAMRKFSSEVRVVHEGLKGFLAKNLTGFVIGWDRVSDGERRYIAAHMLGGAPKMTHTSTVETAQVWVGIQGLNEWLADAHRSWGEDAKGVPWPPPVSQLADQGCEELTVFKVRIVVTPHHKIPVPKNLMN